MSFYITPPSLAIPSATVNEKNRPLSPPKGVRADTSTGSTLVFHIGANTDQSIQYQAHDIRASALGISSVSVSTRSSADHAIGLFDSAIEKTSEIRSELGSIQNRLEHTIANLTNASENMTASESRIRDADMAKEMLLFTRDNILMQAAQSMLAQANRQPEGILQLLS